MLILMSSYSKCFRGLIRELKSRMPLVSLGVALYVVVVLDGLFFFLKNCICLKKLSFIFRLGVEWEGGERAGYSYLNRYKPIVLFYGT